MARKIASDTAFVLGWKQWLMIGLDACNGTNLLFSFVNKSAVE